jgi:hypothetical protein
MFGIASKTVFNAAPVLKAEEKAAFENVGHAAASIRKDAIESIIKQEGASPAGTPPHTRRGQLQRAITFDYSKDLQSALIGPRASLVGLSAVPEEFGGEYKGHEYPMRPFMLPALERAIPRFASSWAGSVGA